MSNGSQLLLNNGFETGDTTSWSYCNPSAATYSGDVTSTKPKSGYYSYEDGSIGSFDYLSQSFSVASGSSYKIRFWLNTGATYDAYAYVAITA